MVELAHFPRTAHHWHRDESSPRTLLTNKETRNSFKKSSAATMKQQPGASQRPSPGKELQDVLPAAGSTSLQERAQF